MRHGVCIPAAVGRACRLIGYDSGNPVLWLRDLSVIPNSVEKRRTHARLCVHHP